MVGFGEACRLAKVEMANDEAHVSRLSQRFLTAMRDEVTHIVLNGAEHERYPGNLNISFACVEGESMIMALKDIAVSSGSACTSASLEPSYVLRAIGVDVNVEQLRSFMDSTEETAEDSNYSITDRLLRNAS